MYYLIFQHNSKNRPNSYQTCVIATGAITAVCPIGKGALLATFLVALLKINLSFTHLNKHDDNKQTWLTEPKSNSLLGVRSHTPLPPLHIHSHIRSSQTAVKRSQESVKDYEVCVMCNSCDRVHSGADVWPLTLFGLLNRHEPPPFKRNSL